jgi:hypothetical protein
MRRQMHAGILDVAKVPLARHLSDREPTIGQQAEIFFAASNDPSEAAFWV